MKTQHLIIKPNSNSQQNRTDRFSPKTITTIRLVSVVGIVLIACSGFLFSLSPQFAFIVQPIGILVLIAALGFTEDLGFTENGNQQNESSANVHQFPVCRCPLHRSKKKQAA